MRLRRAFQLVLGVFLVFSVACSGGSCEKWTAWLVGEGVESGKNTAKGIKEGIAKGRKQGESLDDAKIVSDWESLQEVGSAEIHRIDGDTVELAFSNEKDVPLRVTNLEVLVLDREGFAHEVEGAPPETTVPADARSRVTVRAPVAADRIDRIRIWDRELTPPASATPAEDAVDTSASSQYLRCANPATRLCGYPATILPPPSILDARCVSRSRRSRIERGGSRIAT